MVKKRRTPRAFLIVLVTMVLAGSIWIVYVWFDGGPAESTRPVEATPVDNSDTSFFEYRLVPGQSTASFVVDEILRGDPSTVVGVTEQLDGSILLSFETGTIVMGQFEINLRSLRTGDELRDRTIRSRILQSNRDEFEFSVFDPREVTRTPDAFAVGDRLELQVVGDLQLRDITRETVFTMELAIESREQIRVAAVTEVAWEDFDITVPYVGGDSMVSFVAPTVILRLDVVAATGN